MKAFSFPLLVIGALFSIASNAQTPDAFDPEKYTPPYSLAFPQGWGVERFAIPIDFALSIPYQGVEDLRFAPGWSDSKSNDYWTYAFLWYLKGKPDVNARNIENNLTAYYTGLIGRNIDRRKIPKEKLVPVKVTIREDKPHTGDLRTWSGTIDMLDYMEQKPITLNCVVHLRLCPGKDNTFMFYQISPRASTNEIWKDLQKLWNTFECDPAKP